MATGSAALPALARRGARGWKQVCESSKSLGTEPKPLPAGRVWTAERLKLLIMRKLEVEISSPSPRRLENEGVNLRDPSLRSKSLHDTPPHC